MFVNQVNSKLDCQEHEERVRQINDRIGPYETISAPPELTSVRVVLLICSYRAKSMCSLFFFSFVLKDTSRILS
jgi:hypothetical protein